MRILRRCEEDENIHCEEKNASVMMFYMVVEQWNHWGLFSSSSIVWGEDDNVIRQRNFNQLKTIKWTANMNMFELEMFNIWMKFDLLERIKMVQRWKCRKPSPQVDVKWLHEGSYQPRMNHFHCILLYCIKSIPALLNFIRPYG